MGSVQPFLEGSFLERSCARRFGSIQSEAVIRVGRIRSHEEVEGPILGAIHADPRLAVIRSSGSSPGGDPAAASPGGTSRPTEVRYFSLEGCFRIFQDSTESYVTVALNRRDHKSPALVERRGHAFALRKFGRPLPLGTRGDRSVLPYFP